MKGLPYQVKTLIQKALKSLEAERNRKRRELFDPSTRATAFGRGPLLGVSPQRGAQQVPRALPVGLHAQDAIDAQRDELIKRIEKQLSQRHTLNPVFTFRWTLV